MPAKRRWLLALVKYCVQISEHSRNWCGIIRAVKQKRRGAVTRRWPTPAAAEAPVADVACLRGWACLASLNSLVPINGSIRPPRSRVLQDQLLALQSTECELFLATVLSLRVYRIVDLVRPRICSPIYSAERISRGFLETGVAVTYDTPSSYNPKLEELETLNRP